MCFLDKKYELSDQLPILIPILSIFEEYKDRLLQELLKQMEKGTYSSGGDEEFEYWNKPIHGIAKDIIKRAADYEVYDLTEYDLVDSNTGFIRLREVCNETANKMAGSLVQSMSDWMEGYDNAYSEAASNITGSGVSVWTSSLGGALLYSAMERNVLKQQAKEADRRLNQALKELNLKNDSKMKQDELRIKAEIYYPGCMSAIAQIVSYMFQLYIEKLDHNKKIIYSEIYNYDIKASSEVMKNLDIVSQKREVLGKAFEKCPYNTDVFIAALDRKLLDDASIDTIRYLKIDRNFANIVKEKIGDLKIDQLEIQIRKNEYYIHLYAVLKGKNDTECLRELTQNLKYTVSEKYEYLKKIMSGDSTEFIFRLIKVKNRKNEIVNYVKGIVSDANLNCLITNCGYANLLLEIAPEGYNGELKKEQIDNFYINELSEKYLPLVEAKVAEQEKNRKFEQEQEEKRIQEEKREREIKRKKKKKVTIIVSIIFCIPLMVVMVLQIIKMNNGMDEFETHQKIINEYGKPYEGLEMGMSEVDLIRLLGKPVKTEEDYYYYNDYNVFGIKGLLRITLYKGYNDNRGKISEINWYVDENTDKQELEFLDTEFQYYIEHHYTYKNKNDKYDSHEHDYICWSEWKGEEDVIVKYKEDLLSYISIRDVGIY